MIQTICIIILGAISLLALIDLRKKTKELERLKMHFEYKSNKEIDTVKQEIDSHNDTEKIIMQNHDIKTQNNIIICMLVILLLLISVMFLTYIRGYVKTNNYSEKLNVSFENAIEQK